MTRIQNSDSMGFEIFCGNCCEPMTFSSLEIDGDTDVETHDKVLERVISRFREMGFINLNYTHSGLSLSGGTVYTITGKHTEDRVNAAMVNYLDYFEYVFPLKFTYTHSMHNYKDIHFDGDLISLENRSNFKILSSVVLEIFRYCGENAFIFPNEHR